MATRRERVILDLEDNLSGGLARAAVASRLLKTELNDLGRDSTRAGDGIDRTGTSARKAAPEIDRFSGRLKVLADVAILLGPALVPLGAAAIPALTGALAAMGAAAGGIGVSILALKGVGDAVKALDDYRLEPTADNLQAVRIEMEKLGPAGAHFVRYLESIEDEMRSLQMAAREGLLPGLEDGIDAALERLPGVRDVVRDLAEGMGELARSAGEDFAGNDWNAFFSYLDSDGRNTLVSFGNAIGDLTNGLADMMVAFAPLNRDFTQGFEGMAESFADWAAGLDESQDFKEFLDYLRVTGPQVIDFLGSFAHSLAAVVKAAAPVGAVTLGVLTRFLDLLGALANSPLGTPFIAALVGITAYSRAVDLATAAQTRFNAAKATGFASAGTTLGIAALVVTVAEYADMMNTAEEKTRIWNESMAAGTLTAGQLRAEFKAMEEDESITGLGDLLQTAMDPTAWVKTSFVGARVWQHEVDQMKDEARDLIDEIENGRPGFLGFADAVDEAAAGLEEAKDAAADFQGAIAELEGWLSKRGAIRNYRASIQELAKGLKDGFNRTDRENIDKTAESILQVAEQIKSPALRADFLKNARAGLVDLANNASPKAKAEIEKVIAKLDEFGLTKPKSPKLDIDTSAARNAINSVMSWLNGIPDEDVNINIKRRYSAAGALGVGPAAINNEAPRTTSPRTTAPRTGRGVVPTSLTFGRGSGDDKASLYGGMFGGRGGGQEEQNFLALYEAAGAAAGGLKGLQRELRAAEKAVERETRKRDALQARRDAVSGAVSGDLSNDLFAVSEASSNVWAAGATAGGVMDPLAQAQARRDRAQRYIAAIRKLKGMGLDKGALSAIISEGLEAAEFMASQPQAYVSEFASTLAEANQFVAQAANMGANAVVSVAEMNAANAELKEANQRLKAIEKAIERADKGNRQGQKDQGQNFAATINRTARDGRRRAPR